MDLQKLGTKIKEERKALGLTQEELAQRIGNQKPYVSAIENGKKGNITLEMLAKIAAALGKKLPEEWLLL